MSGLEITPISDVAAKAGVSLDDASLQANTAEINVQKLQDSGELALDFLTTMEFSRGSDFQSDVFGSTAASHEAASEISGKAMGVPEMSGLEQQTVDMMNSLFLASAKFTAAWKCVNGLGKDMKAMLQTN